MIKQCCRIKFLKFAQLDGYYWEIEVPKELHPRFKVKKFSMVEPVINTKIDLIPISWMIPTENNENPLYKGYSLETNKIDIAVSQKFYTELIIKNEYFETKLLDSVLLT